VYREPKPGFFSRFKRRKPQTEEDEEDTRTRREEAQRY